MRKKKIVESLEMVDCKVVLNIPHNVNIYYAVLPMPSSGPMQVLNPLITGVMCGWSKSKTYNCILPDI